MSENKPGKLPFLKDGVAQVAIVVKDLDRTVEQWWKLFGIGPWHFYTYGKPLGQKMSYHGKPVEYEMRLALSYIGNLRVELIEKGKARAARFSWMESARATLEVYHEAFRLARNEIKPGDLLR